MFENIKINNDISITKEYFFDYCFTYLKSVKDIKFNRKSITIYVSNNFSLNSVFDKKYYLNLILINLSMYLENNFNIKCIDDDRNIDYLRNKFKKLNIYYI